MKTAQVILCKTPGQFDQALTYEVPAFLESQCFPGVFVKVPLRERWGQGILLSLDSTEGGLQRPLKPIHSVLPGPTLPSDLLSLAQKISTYYLCSLTRALRLMVPKTLWEGHFASPERNEWILDQGEAKLRGEKQRTVLSFLADQGGRADETSLRASLGVSLATLRSLEKLGVIHSQSQALYANADYTHLPFASLERTLTPDQKKAFEGLLSCDRPALLQGVTGSGKTEVYLRMILETVRQGKQSILLVPEIALTPQTLDYFKLYFGDRLAIFHSRLSQGQRALEWYKARTGYAALVIGSRSAVFAPVPNLGCLILDEEHEWTYKQESAPYYETHAIAEFRAKTEGCRLILGSATPRLETLYKAMSKEYDYFQLPQRTHQQPLPPIQVVDLREEFKQKHYSIFSRPLLRQMEAALRRGEQTILFVNQRGHARAVVCRDCGHTETCPHCEVSLKHHLGAEGFLLCHYCGYRQAPPSICPTCGSAHIRYVGLGTQRVEEEMKKLFPQARLLRADQDTTRLKEGFSEIYTQFKQLEADVLIGTQMIAKGLDFPQVSLIGLVLADVGLHLPDFRAHERLFQLITQVAGRCGRGDRPGQVILQTYNPEHFAIRKAAEYDYEAFAQSELNMRQKLGYPPFHSLIKFIVVGQNLETLRRQVESEVQVLEDIFLTHELPAKVLFAPAMIPKTGGFFHYHVLVRSPNPHLIFSRWTPPKGWRIDVDPVRMA